MQFIVCPFCNHEVQLEWDYAWDHLGQVVHVCDGGTWELAWESIPDFETGDSFSGFYLERA